MSAGLAEVVGQSVAESYVEEVLRLLGPSLLNLSHWLPTVRRLDRGDECSVVACSPVRSEQASTARLLSGTVLEVCFSRMLSILNRYRSTTLPARHFGSWDDWFMWLYYELSVS